MKTLKYEEVFRNEYRDLAEARRSIQRFPEKVYNEKRLHSALGYRPPAEFESSLSRFVNSQLLEKSEGPRNAFLRHDGIYRSDVSSLLINPVQMPPPVGRPRYQAIGRAGRSHTSCPSSAMSSDRLILDRVGRHQCPVSASPASPE